MKITRRLSLLLFSMFSCTLIQAQDFYDIARTGNATAAVRSLKEYPEFLNSKDDNGYSPLILASYYGNEEVVRVLLEYNAQVNENSGYGTALMAATVKDHKNIVASLLAHGADPNIADANGMTALIYAAMFQNIGLAQVLLEHQADQTLKDNRNNTALDYAVLMKNDLLINLLKKHS